MKTGTLLLIATLFVMLISASVARCASEVWSDDLNYYYVLQIYADGSGGCAILFYDSDSDRAVRYYNKKGTIIYEEKVNEYSRILSCSPKMLCYQDGDELNGATIVLVTIKESAYSRQTVKNSGGSISAPNGQDPQNESIYIQVCADRKRFFAVKYNEDDDGGSYELVCYSFI
jgi:hypothetical protein